jgi:CDP-glucose 4,6-dehydratase
MVDDPIKYSDAWNFGPFSEDSLTVGELVEIAISVWGKGEYFTTPIVNQPHEARLLKLDISRTIKELNWQPNFNSKIAIEMTLDWYISFIKNGNSITGEQIQKFLI